MLRLCLICLTGLALFGAGPAAAGKALRVAAAAAAADKTPHGRILRVGPKRKLRAPSMAARMARDGDTVEIDAATYRDCAVWRASRLTIRGVGGRPHVKDVSCQGKAIWVVYGNVTKIENIEFSGSRVEHRNGAGIRFEGGILSVRDIHVHHNQMGILTHNRPHMWLVVRDSIFENNGNCPTFCGHGVYAGLIKGLKVINSQFRGHRFGHHIKSRASYNEIIGNRIDDGPVGTASFAIELPNGGTAKIRKNHIVKGPRASNKKAIIAIGAEGLANRSRGISVSENTFHNLGAKPTFFVWSRGVPVRMGVNTFEGEGKHLHSSGATARRHYKGR